MPTGLKVNILALFWLNENNDKAKVIIINGMFIDVTIVFLLPLLLYRLLWILFLLYGNTIRDACPADTDNIFYYTI